MKNLVAHILRKDFRHLWPWLALWWGTFVLLALYPVWAFSHALYHGETANDDPLYAVLLYAACGVLFLITIGRLIETDAPINDASFWRTLPVPPARMLAAKLLFVVLFCLLAPAFIYLVAYRGYGLSWAQTWYALGFFGFVWIFLQFHFFAAGLFFRKPAIGFAVLTAIYLGLILLFTFLSSPPQSVAFSARPGLGAAISYVGLFAAISLIYVQQRRAWALFALLCGFLLAAGYRLIAPSTPPPSFPLLPGEALPAFSLNLPGVDFIWLTDARNGSVTRYITSTLPSGTLPDPADHVWFPVTSFSTLTWLGNSSAAPISLLAFDTHGSMDFNSTPATGLPLNFTAALRSYGITHLLTATTPANPTLGVLPADVWDKLKHDSANLTGNVSFAVGNLDESARLPLIPGSVHHRGPVTTGLISVTPDPDAATVSVFLVTRGPNDDPAAWYDDLNFFLLVNLARGEAVLGYNVGMYSDDVGMFRTERRRYIFSVQPIAGLGHPVSADALHSWLSGAQFLQLRFMPLGNRAGTFTVNPVHINQPKPQATSVISTNSTVSP